LSENDPYSCADLDDCLDPNTKEIDPKMDAILEALNSYSEISPHGTGIHVWVQGKVRTLGKKPVEIYSRKHMITVTGRSLSDFPSEIKKRTDELADLRRRYAPAKATAPVSKKTPIPVPSDQHRSIRQKIMDSGNGKKFARLWDGDCSGYPSQSEADLALCRILAPYCGCREDIVDQLFRQSAMFRDKWNFASMNKGTRTWRSKN
jgi:putative DNA primase/helicase